jgi:hypothetical protein
MIDQNQDDIPGLWSENGPPSDCPESTFPPPASTTWGDWIACLSPARQLAYGCLGIMVISAALLYCVGASTFFIRPIIAAHAAQTPTEFIRPTLLPTPTQMIEPTTFIPLPKGTLVATPTQAPIPPRDSFVVTPGADIMNKITLTPFATSTPTGSVSPTRKPGGSATPRP